MKKEDAKYSIQILIILILMSNGVTFVFWPSLLNRLLTILICAFLLISSIRYISNLKSYVFGRVIIFVAFYPFISIFTSAYLWNQGPYNSVNVLLPHLLWLLYFNLHKYQVSEKAIYRGFLYFALTIVALQVVQQFTYPAAYWGIYSDKAMANLGSVDNVDIRNGIYRFRLDQNAYVTMFVLLFCFNKIKEKFQVHYLVLVVFMLISVYLTLTRQVMASCMAVLLLSIFGKRMFNFKLLFFLILVVFICYSNYDVLFENMSDKTETDLSEDNIRVFSYAFYIEKIIDSPIAFLFGNGLAGGDSVYKKFFDMWTFDWGYYTVDIGIIGYWFHYGVIYILMFFYINYLLLIKYRHEIPSYIRMTTLFTLIMSPMIFPYWGKFCYCYWPFLFYIGDCYIRENRRLV